MGSTSPSATFAPCSAASHDTAAILLSEALARASHAELQAALAVLNDDLLGALSAFAGAICQDRQLLRLSEVA
jgi:hypothetical protein